MQLQDLERQFASVIAEKLIAMGEIDRVIVIAPLNEVVRQWVKNLNLLQNDI